MKKFLLGKNKYLGWLLLALTLTSLLFFPLIFILEGLGDSSNENVQHIQQYLLWDLIRTTIRMVLGTVAIAVVLGLPIAYLTATFDFPLRRLLRTANILPIAVPTYIMAFVYSSIFSVSGSFIKLQLYIFGEDFMPFRIDVMRETWLMLFLGFALFPYVYSACLASFSIQNKSLDEAAASLGAGAWKRFFKLHLPLVFPALLSGIALVTMEVVNDYGAMSYFNVNTITAGIFQAKQMDFKSSVYLSAMVFIGIFSFYMLFYFFKSTKKITHLTTSGNNLKQLTKFKRILITFFVAIPCLLGFIVPLMELLYLASFRLSTLTSSRFLITIFNSAQLAIIPAIIVVIVTLILLYNQYINKGRLSEFLSYLSTLGYAIPGAIIAVAVMAFVIYFDSPEKRFYHWSIDALVLLIFAYILRFLAVGYHTLEGAFLRISHTVPDAARSLGASPLKTFFRISFPIIKPAVLTTVAVVMVDILKELPITLLLQRFNFDTLATVTFEKVKITESVRDASPYALLLIFVGTIGVLLLMGKENKG
ncbi:MAG: iron ABC transporter permease [Crocinitomicaceae bacterium]|nr:iron ABC transporter permease [Crocinitomicaceae bacterium]